MPTTYALNGVNFEEQEFTPTSDCAIWRSCISDGILQGMAITAAGSGIKVAAGWVMAGGKELQLPAAITVPATEQLSGFARLLVNVDLSRTSTEQSFLQGWISIEYASSREAFATLTQGDLAGTGTVYQMVLCVVSLGSAGVTGVVYTCGPAHGRAAGVQLTLPASGWSDNRQTVRCDGVRSDVIVRASYDPASREDYLSAGVFLAAQGDGTLTFAADLLPLTDLTVNILLQ